MRASLAAFPILLVALTAPRVASGSEVLRAIDDAFQAGRITEAQRVTYRVAAVRSPGRLPEAFRELVRSDGPVARSHTRVLVEAYQALPTLKAAAAAEVRDLLMPPPDLDHAVETTTPYPIRVSYGSPGLQSKAERILQAAVTSYEREVVDWGFWEPPIEDGAELYRYYVMDAGGAAGYTAPYLGVASTPHTDSYSYIVIDPMLSGLSIDATVAHEFNHACQVAMDVAELPAFMENSASYIEAAVFPATWPLTQGTFAWFQSQPYRPLEYTRGYESDGYEYGGALWALFLSHVYGADDPRWLRQVWEGTVQESYENEPDYFDVLDELLAADGGLAAAAKQFAEYRFFVGSDDDGQHLPNAGQWGGAEVWRTATLRQSQLPISNQGPTDDATRPQPNGCNYVVLELDDTEGFPLRYSFDGDHELEWHVGVMKVGAALTTTVAEMELDEQADGSLVVSPTDAERIVLMICQTMAPGYDPDDRPWHAGDYLYGIHYDIPAPTVTGVSPSELEQGAHDIIVTITGSGFYNHPDLHVAVTGDKVLAELERFISPGEIELRVAVAPTAELGARSVLVTNPGGATGRGDDLLTIVPPTDLPSTEDSTAEDESGCACRQAGRAASPGWLLVGLCAAALGPPLRRRRRGQRPPP